MPVCHAFYNTIFYCLLLYLDLLQSKTDPNWTKEAVSKFLSDVQEQYNMKVGFEQNMRDEVIKLAQNCY
jgi:hypothetical protein